MSDPEPIDPKPTDPAHQSPARRDQRPRSYPAPKFPPRRVPAFAHLPPAVFTPLLGLLGLVLALRATGQVVAMPAILAAADIAAGLVLALWVFAVLGLAIKLIRRASVLIEDLKPLPGRAGLAAAVMGGMAAGGVLAPFAPRLAMALIMVSVLAHLIIGGMVIRVLLPLGAEGRAVNPVWHMHLVGITVAAVPLASLGQVEIARAILWITLPLAALVWGLSIVQLTARLPPAPLRPLLFIHLAPAALLSLVTGALGEASGSKVFLALAILIFSALLLSLRWIMAAGFSPMWGAMTFPMAAFAAALIASGGWFQFAGMVLISGLSVGIPLIAWRILKLWPGGQLAAKTNAAEA